MADPAWSEYKWFVATGDTITFTLTNCDQFQIADFDGAILDSGTIVAPIVVNAGEVATFTDTGTSTQHAAWVTALSPEHVPAGVLNVTSSITIPAVAPELDLSSDNLGNGNHYVGDSDSNCAVSAGMQVYRHWSSSSTKLERSRSGLWSPTLSARQVHVGAAHVCRRQC
ncbi:MAG: hypothetical protein WCI22_16275 [Actinomycetota bacterium]